MTTTTNKLSKTQAIRAFEKAGIAADVQGRGYEFTAEVAANDREAARAIMQCGGYATGYDTFVFDTGYTPVEGDDFCEQHTSGASETSTFSASTLGDIVS